MDTVVIYKANIDSAEQIIQLLRKEGFNPTIFEDPGSIAPYTGRAYHYVRGTCLMSIAVPREEARAAASVLHNWDIAKESKVREITNSLRKSFLYATAITAVLAIIFLFLGILSNASPLLFLAWLVLFALIANADRLRRFLLNHHD